MDAAYRFAMFHSYLCSWKFSIFWQNGGRKFHYRVKGIFSYSDPPRAGMPIGVWDRRQGEQGVRGVLYAPRFQPAGQAADQNIGDRQLVVDVLARADLIDQIAFELATESSAFVADVVHGAASVENWGTCRFARERSVGEADALSRACGLRPR